MCFLTHPPVVVCGTIMSAPANCYGFQVPFTINIFTFCLLFHCLHWELIHVSVPSLCTCTSTTVFFRTAAAQAHKERRRKQQTEGNVENTYLWICFCVCVCVCQVQCIKTSKSSVNYCSWNTQCVFLRLEKSFGTRELNRHISLPHKISHSLNNVLKLQNVQINIELNWIKVIPL